jgi:hypothetical protein
MRMIVDQVDHAPATSRWARRWALAGLVAIGLAMAAGGGSASAASLVTCTGTEQITFTPGLKNTKGTVSNQIEDRFGSSLVPCVSSDPSLHRGTSSFTFLGEGSCLEPAFVADVSQDILWDNGQTSTFAFTTRNTIVNGITASLNTGTITAGEFAGASATLIIAETPTLAELLACASPAGLSSFSGPLTFAIVG